MAASKIPAIYSLPNELLYTILEPFPTADILTICPTSHRIHALCVRLLHHRLTLAAGLADHTLYLEIFPPSKKQTVTGLYCRSLGTPGLEESVFDYSRNGVGAIGRMRSLYSSFCPERANPVQKVVRRHPAGDIPGSRTHPATVAAESSSHDAEDEADLIGETVSLDAHELFTQLCTVTNLIMMRRPGVFTALIEVCDGMIRVWRDWLKEQARGVDGASTSDGDISDQPKDNHKILWVNKYDSSIGIKCRVRERKLARANPILFTSDDEVAVSYHLEFQELYIRTSHLLFNLEESLKQQEDRNSRAIILGGLV